jgi:NADH-ubiquinone oxidoreductase chain 5
MDPRGPSVLVHFILEMASLRFDWSANLAYWLGTLTVSLTTFYSYRLVFLTFLNRNNSFKRFVMSAAEADLAMAIPLILLSFGSIFIGYLSRDMIIGSGSAF